MILNKRFTKIDISSDNLVLGHTNNSNTEILFSDLDKIYIKQYKVPTIFEIILILFVFCIGMIFYLNNYIDAIELFPITLIFIAAIVKMINYKSYDLKVYLKNGNFYIKQIQSKNKYETIDFIHEVRKEITSHEMKNQELFLPNLSLA